MSDLLTRVDQTPVDELPVLIDEVVERAASLPRITSVPLLTQLIQRIKDDESLLQRCLEKLTPHASTFEEQVSQVRETLATKLEAEQAYLEAARVLQGLSLESGQRQISDDYKLRTYIRIVRCLLEEDEAVDADTYLSRATALMHTQAGKEDPELQLHFKLSQARVLDAKRKFQEASQRYIELADNDLVAPEEQLKCIEAAIACAVLAPAGKQRSRTLRTLFRDARHARTNPVSAKVLEKMHLQRLITQADVSEFEQTLRPQQSALVPDAAGSMTTLLARAVTEHNIIALSHVYENILLSRLPQLLGVPHAERIVREMIVAGRLRAVIDQVDGVLFLLDQSDAADDGAEDEELTAEAGTTMLQADSGVVEDNAATKLATTNARRPAEAFDTRVTTIIQAVEQLSTDLRLVMT
ncbi:hypothetical protein PYCC9005_003272 [Savitreella phatthalungensis]